MDCAAQSKKAAPRGAMWAQVKSQVPVCAAGSAPPHTNMKYSILSRPLAPVCVAGHAINPITNQALSTEEARAGEHNAKAKCLFLRPEGNVCVSFCWIAKLLSKLPWNSILISTTQPGLHTPKNPFSSQVWVKVTFRDSGSRHKGDQIKSM